MSLLLRTKRPYLAGIVRSHVAPFAVFLPLLFLGMGHTAFASDAVLYLWPNTGMYTAETVFTLNVLVNSGGEPVNAIEGELLYDPQMLEVLEVSRERSVVSSWTLQPVISQEEGVLMFGGMLATSTVLERGEVLTLHLRARRSGDTELSFDSGSAAVRAADGTGGNILTALNRGIYQIVPEEQVIENIAAPEPEETGEVLGAATGTALTIVSSSHPDEEAWYSTTTGIFSWESFPDTAKTMLALNKRASWRGGVLYQPPINTKLVTGLDEGVQFFHVTLVSGSGKEERATYRVGVDTLPPTALKLEEVSREDPALPRVAFKVSADDETSGVDHYTFSIDGGAPVFWKDDGSHTYQTGVLSPREHEMVMAAVDRAGNRAEAKLKFSITRLSAPRLSLMSDDPHEGGTLSFSVEAVPNGNVALALSQNDEKPVIEKFSLDASGKGSYQSALRLAPGTYHVFATVERSDGALSSESERITVESRVSAMGLIGRHPMVIPASIVLVVLLISPFVFLKKLKRKRGEGFYPETDDGPSVPSVRGAAGNEPLPQERASGSPSSHTIVLPKKAVRHPITPTRL